MILILAPRPNKKGGIASHYNSLSMHFSIKYDYIYRGSDINKENIYEILHRFIKDYFLFCKRIWKTKQILIVNNSLGPGSFFRDGLYIILTPRNRKKIVFFHGWNPAFEKKIERSNLYKNWMRRTFLKADHIIVLSSNFKKKLIEWGYNSPISKETTSFNEKLLEGENFRRLSQFRKRLKYKSILYLGNISHNKGVHEIIEGLRYLKVNLRIECIKGIIAGDGQEFDALHNYCGVENLNIDFPGYVKGRQKAFTFKNAHIYVFASFHEGMPISVIEAMAFGLPVITTRVGGLPDFFEDGKMGLFLNNREPAHIAEKIKYLLERPKLMKEMSAYNYNYAKVHFYAGKVAQRFQNIVESVIKEKHE